MATPMIQIEGLEAVRTWLAGLKGTLLSAAADEVEAASEALQEDIASQMPVDTGWAQSRWGELAVPGGVWTVSEDKLAITQGSDLESQLNLYEYITRLNEGSSRQAPAGFIDVAAERAGENLSKRLDEIADLVD